MNAWKCAPPTTDHDPANTHFLFKNCNACNACNTCNFLRSRIVLDLFSSCTACNLMRPYCFRFYLRFVTVFILQKMVWPDSCGFVVLPEWQTQRLTLRHGSIKVVLAIGLRATERTCHDEQWLHLKFAGRKAKARCIPCRRRVASRILCCAPTSTRPRVVRLVLLRKVLGPLALAFFNLRRPRRPVGFTAVDGTFCSFFVILG